MIRRHPIVFAMLCVLVTAVLGLLLRPLTPIDETRYLSVAWEMHQSNNWLVPTKNFATYTDKPPLLFWAINVMWLVTGVSEFAARLIGPLFATLAVWLTARLARNVWPEDRGVGGRAAMALAGMVVFALSGSMTMFDVPLTVAVLAGLIALAATGTQGWAAWAGFGAALALGGVTKGPVILFHLMPAALLLPLWRPVPMRWRDLPLRIVFAIAVGLALVALWLVPAISRGGPAYRDAILWHQSAERLTESFAHARPVYWYLIMLPVLGFPLLWSPDLWRAARHTAWWQDRGLRLCLIWGGAALVLFSLTSGKQLHYLVPELPAVALMAARIGRREFRLQPAAAVMVLAALAAVVLVFVGLPDRLQTLLAPASALLTWALLVLALCWLTMRWKGFVGAMTLALGLMLVSNLLVGTTRTATVFSTHPIASQMAAQEADGLGYVGDRYHAEFNFAGRLTHPVAELGDRAAVRAWIADHPMGLIVGRIDRSDMAWRPRDAVLFRNRDYGLWYAADAPQSERNAQ